MSEPTGFVIYPMLDENYNFPTEVRQAMADSSEIGIKVALAGAGKVSTASKGVAGGVAQLDNAGKVPDGVLPDRLSSSSIDALLTSRTAPRRMGIKTSPILFRKIKGGNIAPKPGGGAWKGLFAQWDWVNWIKPQVDRAAALGLNAIRLIGDPGAIFVDPNYGTGTLPKISQSTYDAQWMQIAQYCQDLGLYLYPCLIGKWSVLDVLGLGGNYQDAAITNSVKTTAGILSGYSNVIGFDLFQEGDAWSGVAWAPSTAYSLNAYVNLGGNAYKATTAGTSASSGGPTGTGSSITDGTVVWAYQAKALLPTDVLAMMAAVRTVSNLPLTMSRSMSDGYGWNDTTSMWYQVFNSTSGADFLDFHLYLDGILPSDPDFQLMKSGKPFLIGEFGSQQSILSATQVARYQAVASIHNRRGLIGSFVWALADQKTSSNPEDQWGVWDNTGYVAGAFPAASTAPLSTTAGRRVNLSTLLPTFGIADRFEATYKPQNLLSPTQAKPRNNATLQGTGWLGGSNTYLYAEPRGLGFSATATGTSFAATSMNGSWRIPVVGATYYRGKLDILAGATPRAVSFNVDWYDSSGTYITSSTAATGTDSTTIPLTLNLLVRSHTNAAYAVMIAKVTDATQLANEAHIVLEAELIPAQ